MSLLLLFFFLMYGGIHYYLLTQLREALQPSLPNVLSFGLILAFLVFSPAMVHIIERDFGLLCARFFAYMSYCWMGFVFFFFCISLIFDLYRLVLRCIHYFFPRNVLSFIPTPEFSFLFSVSLSLLIFVYGLHEVRDIRMERLIVQSAKIPSFVKKIRVVQVSDLHIGLIMRGERLKKAITMIQEANPDILVSTGDLVDGQSDSLSTEYPVFQQILPRFGKFAVTGNHELYAGLEKSLDFTRRAGFTVLRRDAVSINGLLNIAGLDDVVVRRAAGEPEMDVSFKKTLGSLSRDKFTLFLYHRPTIDLDYLGAFDLQLSGHTHNGQIFPFTLVTHLFFPMQTGYFMLPHQSSLYVSRGTGTWGPPIRFLSPPQITVIDLVPPK